MGPNGCNGHGAVSPRGGKYRQRRTDPLPTWAIGHAECNATGRTKCGCKKTLTAEQKAVLAGTPWTEGERWSSIKGRRITAPRRRKPRAGTPRGRRISPAPVVVELTDAA
jgi:hypothetical protein